MIALRQVSMVAGIVLFALSGCSDGGPPGTAVRHTVPEKTADAAALAPDAGGDASEALTDAGALDAGSTTARLCDGVAGITFSGAAVGGGIAVAGTEAMAENGHSFIIVEGTCRFWALKGRLERVVTGELMPSDVASLSEAFELDRWGSCRSMRIVSGSDAPELRFVFGRSERGAGDAEACMERPSASAGGPDHLMAAYYSTLERLTAVGKPIAGDIRYLLVEKGRDARFANNAAAWPLSDPADVALSTMTVAHNHYEPGTSRLAQGRDADALREIWQNFLDDEQRRRPGSPPAPEGVPIEFNGIYYEWYVRDSIPLEDARGIITY